jgi:3-oxoisoapionate kinase
MNTNSGPLLSFYGDDFTGSTDAMEALSLNGLRTVLFLSPPSPELLHERFADLPAIGVAGFSRTWSPAQMEERLRPIFEGIRQLAAPLVHYKTCSTFDSSPEVGSIGRAIDIGHEVFGGRWVPLVVGAPVLRRYTLFGNLFATVGNETYRLDRHPTMRHHPVTPMNEADLRVHLSQQTAKSIALFDILQLTGSPDEIDQRFSHLRDQQPDVVLFDVLDDARLAEAGRLIAEQASTEVRFVAGSSGVEYALAAHWRAQGVLPARPTVSSQGPVDRLLVVSGSCSPETQRQIDWALDHGFVGIAVDTVRLLDEKTAGQEHTAIMERALVALAQGQSVVIHTSLGPRDPRLAATAEHLVRQSRHPREGGERIGLALGQMLRELLQQTGLRRAMVAGGDTSGHVTQQLGIYALELIAPVAPGSPLCRAYSDDSAFDGLQIALKGGQVGKADYFCRVMQGGA